MEINLDNLTILKRIIKEEEIRSNKLKMKGVLLIVTLSNIKLLSISVRIV